MATNYRFGHIEGFPPGTRFRDRKELAAALVHIPLMHGISGRADTGASSIVASGGYEDDKDQGDILIYTGEGGRDPESGKQVRHQTLTRGNAAMAKSYLDGLPIRVIKGSIKTGYVYEGLYSIVSYEVAAGKSGFEVFQFHLVKLSEDESIVTKGTEIRSVRMSNRQVVVVQRIVRDSVISRAVKTMYDYTCQVCGVRIETPAGPYAEGAHIRPLGRPHNGSDDLHNLLCLCPNHHVLFDNFAFSLSSDGSLVGIAGTLRMHGEHKLREDDVAYHFGQWNAFTRG